MLKIIVLSILSGMCINLTAQTRVLDTGLIKGDISKLNINCDALVITSRYQLKSSIAFYDTVRVKNGQFEFHYKVKESRLADICLLYKKKNVGRLTFIEPNPALKDRYAYFGSFYLDNSLTKISVDNENKKIIGSKKNPYYTVTIEGSPETNLFFFTERNKIKKVTKELVEKNNGSYFLLQWIWEQSEEYSAELLEELCLSFSHALKESYTYKTLISIMKRNKNLALNGFSNGFPLLDTLGRSYSFEQVSQNKPVLLVYWASWCGPCREEIPKLKEFYESYGNKVHIISLSIDEVYKDWRNAVRQEGMPWLNVSRLPNTPKYVSDYYAIKSVPTMILLDKQGMEILRVQQGFEQIKKAIESL